MRIAIAGGTGLLGGHVASELRSRGHEVRVLSRRSPDYPVDLTTGEGLGSALAGCDVVAAFAAASQAGDLDRLIALLDPDVVWRGDGGGKVAAAPLERGAPNVAQRLLALADRPPLSARMALVNGAAGMVLRHADGVLTVVSFTIDAGRIVAIDAVRNPDKLSGLPEREEAAPGE